MTRILVSEIVDTYISSVWSYESDYYIILLLLDSTINMMNRDIYNRFRKKISTDRLYVCYNWRYRIAIRDELSKSTNCTRSYITLSTARTNLYCET